MTHTPLPWRQEDGTIMGADPHNDGEIYIAETAPNGAALTEYDEDNAKFIVHACNSHETLVEVLQTIADGGCESAEYMEGIAAVALNKLGLTRKESSMPTPTRTDHALLETVADIAWIAGAKGYYSGNSRDDIQEFISWAQEFETHKTTDKDGNEKYFGTDYMDAVDDFTTKKIEASGNEACAREARERIALWTAARDLVTELDSIGFADEDSPVNGGDCVDTICRHIDNLRVALAARGAAP
jgi:hypothetical protein